MLKQYALRIGAWQASGYLLNHGAAQPAYIPLGYRLREESEEKSEPYLKALITQNDINDIAQAILLPHLSRDLKSFTDLVDRTWADNEFYTAAFEHQRLRLAMTLFTGLDTTCNSHFPAIFQHLCRSSSVADAESSTNAKVLSCITWGLGNIIWKDQDVASKWYSAIRHTALRLEEAIIMPKTQLLGNDLFWFPSIQIFPTSTPFTDMFLPSMIMLPGYNKNPKRKRQHKIGSRLANCERSVRIWLGILQECGIDLLGYGRQERQRMKNQESGWVFNIWRDVWHESRFYRTYIHPNSKFEVRLISFEYGRQPGDWKLWWSEPTDGLVGDFWKEMESDAFCIPGSWEQDF